MLEWLFGKKKQPQQPSKKEKKPKRSKQQQEQQDKWMYDFLVEFLSSPVWRVSILDFTDNKCLVFDNEEENKFEYTIIHNQFKQLVANLFDGWISQVGVPQEKLAELLQRGFQSKQKKLFNQLLLCDDFMKFKQLMLKRNKALQQQAIRAMRGQARKPTKLQAQRAFLMKTQKEEEQRRRLLDNEEEQILRKVLELSVKEAQQNEAIQKLEYATFAHQAKLQESKLQGQEPINIQKQQFADNQAQKQVSQKEDRKQRIRAKLKKQKLKPMNQPVNGQADNTSVLPPLKMNNRANEIKEETEQISEKAKIIQSKPEEPIKVQQAKEQERSEQKQAQAQQDRKKRLLEQREKIRKKKQQQRKKMLAQSHVNHDGLNVVLQEDGIHDSHIGHQHKGFQEQAEQVKVSKDQLERRKALMKKIKNRIVDDF